MKTTVLFSCAAVVALLAAPLCAQSYGGETAGSKNAGTSSTDSSNSTGTATGAADTKSGSASPMNNNNTTSWDAENSFWSSNYSTRPYANSTRNYSVYQPAYRYGVDLYNQNPGKRYDDLNQPQLGTDWNQARGTSNLDWSDAQLATRDAYDRMYNNSVNNPTR